MSPWLAITAIAFAWGLQYVELSLYINQVILYPNFYVTALPLVLAPLLSGTQRIWIARNSTLFAVIFVASLAASTLIYGADIERVGAFVQACLAFLFLFVFIQIGACAKRSDFSRFCLVASVFLIAIASLERGSDAVKAFSDGIRFALYDEQFVYTSLVRDLSEFGYERPKVFSREPSLLGLNISLLMICWFVAANFRVAAKAAIACPICIVAYLIVGSPSLLIATILIALSVLARTGLPLAMVSLSLIMVGPFAWMLVGMFSGVGQVEDFLEGGSFYMRQVIPFELLINSDVMRVLFGAGIGGYSILTDEAIRLHDVHGTLVQLGATAVEQKANQLISNSFWEYWIILGLGFGVVAAYVLRNAFRSLGIQSTSSCMLLCALIVSASGGVFTTRTAFYVSFIAIAYLISERGEHG